MKAHRLGTLRELTPALAQRYLAERAQQVGQSQLNADRQALQAHLGQRLERVQSEAERPDWLAERGRAYTPEQVALIRTYQPPHQALATEIAHAAGLRAHELLTLRPASEQPAATHRTWREDRFEGREGARYTVQGKGGLVREVCLPQALAARLEATRLGTQELGHFREDITEVYLR